MQIVQLLLFITLGVSKAVAENPQCVPAVICNQCQQSVYYHPSKKTLWCPHCKKEVEGKWSDCSVYATSEDAPKKYSCPVCGLQQQKPALAMGYPCPKCQTWIFLGTVPRRYGNYRFIPFTLTKEEVVTLLKAWLKKGFFAPSDLKQIAKVENLRGIYYPCSWNKVNVEATYKAEIGKEINNKTEYFPHNGIVHNTHEVMLAEGGNTLKGGIQAAAMDPPYDLLNDAIDAFLPLVSSSKELEEMKPLIGYYVYVHISSYDNPSAQNKRYINDLAEKLKPLVYDDAEDELDRDINIDTYRFLEVQHINIHQWEHEKIWVPLWITAYRYKGKKYYVIVNGVTGEITGDKPVSVIKVSFVVIGVLAVIGIGVFLYFRYRRRSQSAA